jgi:hypothetical protein
MVMIGKMKATFNLKISTKDYFTRFQSILVPFNIEKKDAQHHAAHPF